jgi:thioesterase domain-containing protein
VLVDEIPKGATGKLQRIGLAGRLGVGPFEVGERRGDTWPRSSLERELAKIWADVLELPRVGVRDDFFALGGDSILGAEAVARTRDLLDRPDLPLVSLVRAPTVEAMAREILDGATTSGSCFVQLQGGSRPPFVLVHGLDGDIVGFAGLSRRLGDDQPVYGVRARGIDGETAPHESVPAAAADYVAELRRLQPAGPYYIGGMCMGGGVALEMARLLADSGEQVGLLALVDPRIAVPGKRGALLRRMYRRFRERTLVDALRARLRAAQAAGGIGPFSPPARPTTPVSGALERARNRYFGAVVDVPVTAFVTDEGRRFVPDTVWARLLRGPVEHADLPGVHSRMFYPPTVDALGQAMAASLRRAQLRGDAG